MSRASRPPRRTRVRAARACVAPTLVALVLGACRATPPDVGPPKSAARDSDAGQADPWTWDVAGLMGLQARVFGGPNRKHDGLETDLAALVLDGEHADGARLRLEADLDGEDSRHHLAQAWFGVDLGARATLRAGWLPLALASEAATRDEELPYLGRSFPSPLLRRTDLALQLAGRPHERLFGELSLGAGHGAGSEGERRDGRAGSLRLLVTPAPDEDGAFEGAFVGASFVAIDGFDEPLHLVTPLEETVFDTPRLHARRARFALVEVGARAGPFRGGVEHVFGEGVQSFGTGVFGARPPDGGARVDLRQIGAWSLFVAWTFGGDAPPHVDGAWRAPAPAAPGADPPLGELALRYANADIDRALFEEGFTTYDPSTQEVRAVSASFAHRPRARTRLLVQWTRVLADDELTTFGGENRSTSWALRWDERF